MVDSAEVAQPLFSDVAPMPPESALEEWSVEPVVTDGDAVDEAAVTEGNWEPLLTLDDALNWLDEAGATVHRDYDANIVTGIDLAFLRITNKDLQVFSFFPELTELDLTGTDVTDSGLEAIVGLSALESLKLRGTGISDDGLTLLTGFKALKILDLSRTRLTDQGLASIAELPHLRYLLLNHTQISDSGLEQLNGLQSLKGLNLIGASVSQEGVSRLQSQLPECVIISATNEDLSAVRPPDTFAPVVARRVGYDAAAQAKDAQFRALVELAEQQPELAEHLATVCASNKRWQEAVKILEGMTRAQPQNAELCHHLAEALVNCDRRIDALEVLRPVAGDAAAHHAVGVIVFRTALTASEELLQRSLDLDPNNSETRRQMQLVRAQIREQFRADNGTLIETAATDWVPDVKPGNYDADTPSHNVPSRMREPQLPSWQQARTLPASWLSPPVHPTHATSLTTAPGFLRQ